MHLTRTLFFLLATTLMGACTSIKPVAQGTTGIVLAAPEMRVCGQGQVHFPAGLYTPQVVSAKGTYYQSPAPLRTRGVLLGRAETGGIYVSNAPGNPQAAWFGDVNDTVEDHPTTLFSAIGVAAPKLWPYTPRIPFVLKGKTKP